MALQIDPTQNKDQHCKVYVERDVKDAIRHFQTRRGYGSFSEAARALILEGLGPFGTGPLSRAAPAPTADG